MVAGGVVVVVDGVVVVVDGVVVVVDGLTAGAIRHAPHDLVQYVVI